MRFPQLSYADIDLALRPIAKELPTHADLILDIRAAARERRHPGSCVRCFFQLISSAPKPGCLHLLRSWLEQHIEIVASEPQQTGFERFPMQLEETDLETYCRRVMEQYHLDRCRGGQPVHLEFRYRQTAGEREASECSAPQ